MADETEVLDWDEDEAPLAVADNDEDAVSLGASDEEPEAPEVPVAAPENIPKPPPPRSSRENERERRRDSREHERDHNGHRERERRPPKMTLAPPVMHALPPKPLTSVSAFALNLGSGIEATLMAPSSLKDGKDGKPKSTATPTEGKPKSSATSNGAGTPGAHHANLKNSSSDRDRGTDRERERDSDDWDLRQSSSSSRHPNSTRSSYKGSWERAPSDDRDRERPRRADDRRADNDHHRDRDRPSAHSTRGQHRRDDPRSTHAQSGNMHHAVDGTTANPNGESLSYQDRHYRPESAMTSTASALANGNNSSDHNAHSLGSRPAHESPSPPSRAGGRGRARREENSGGGGSSQRWSPPPPHNNNPNNIRSGSGSQSSYPPDPSAGDFDSSSKRPPPHAASQGWGPDRDRERERDRKYRDPTRDRADPERDRDHRGVQGQTQGQGQRPFDDGESRDRDRRAHPPRPEEGRERERDRRDGREREPRDGPPHREAADNGWPRQRERELPPHQYDREHERKYNDSSVHDASVRKQDGGRDTPPHVQTQGQGRGSNSNSNLTLTSSQAHSRDPETTHMHPSRVAPQQQVREQRDRDPKPQPRPMMPAPRHSRRSRSRSRSESPSGAQQRKREKTRFAPLDESASGRASVPSQLPHPPSQTSASANANTMVEVTAAFGLVTTTAIDAFVPDELLEDAKAKDVEAERPGHKEREREERKEERPERGRQEKVEETVVIRKRAPLPPQEQIFQDERRYGKSHSQPFSQLPPPPVSARFPPLSEDYPPLGPKDALPPPVDRVPSGPRRSSSRGRHTTTMQVDTDMPSPRDIQPFSEQQQPNSAQVPTPTSSYPPGQGGPPIRAGSGMYADREAGATSDSGGVPRGPRAMATTPTGGSFGYGPASVSTGAASGGLEGSGAGGYGRGRGRDRSPPPHMDRHSRGGEGYRSRGRGSSGAAYISGSNNAVILRRLRRLQVDLTKDSRIMGFAAEGEVVVGDADEDRTLVRRGTPETAIDLTMVPMQNQAVMDLLRWNEMCLPPIPVRKTIMKKRNLGSSENLHRRGATQTSEATHHLPRPPLPRQSSQMEPMEWDYNDGRQERPERYPRRADDGPPVADRTKSERDRYPPTDEPRRSLEDRITLPSPQELRTAHPLPLNPLRRDAYSPEESRQSTSHGPPGSFHGHQPPEGERRGSFRKDRDVPPHSDNLVDRVGGYNEAASGRPSKNARTRRSESSLDNNTADGPSGSSSHHRASEDVSEHGQRPSGMHRSASLLERMTVGDGANDGKAGSFDEPPSLRDRVQIPSKRERDDRGVAGSSPDAYGRDPYFEGDEELATKRRRKNGKPKRGRRGPP
ncbi:WW domain-containing protein [Mycena sanguinolenta]|uniref:WW domain-containing protein n=1 Tax=Mycena sanguinolenta TaxID=230812 RepID=A0A8H6XDU9_9AGAR|nr:WW domain-containing protein [Mycena sanguinolenta]